MCATKWSTVVLNELGFGLGRSPQVFEVYLSALQGMAMLPPCRKGLGSVWHAIMHSSVAASIESFAVLFWVGIGIGYTLHPIYFGVNMGILDPCTSHGLQAGS